MEVSHSYSYSNQSYIKLPKSCVFTKNGPFSDLSCSQQLQPPCCTFVFPTLYFGVLDIVLGKIQLITVQVEKIVLNRYCWKFQVKLPFGDTVRQFCIWGTNKPNIQVSRGCRGLSYQQPAKWPLKAAARVRTCYTHTVTQSMLDGVSPLTSTSFLKNLQLSYQSVNKDKMARQNKHVCPLEKPLKGMILCVECIFLHLSLWQERETTKSVFCLSVCSVTGGELFEDIVAREYYSEADARYSMSSC